MKFEMEKEIYVQPEVLKELTGMFIKNGKADIELPEKIDRILMVASGSSYNGVAMFKALFEDETGLPVIVEYSSEFAVKENVKLSANDLFIFLSQSGETSDTLQCLKMAKAQGAKTLCITNCPDSTLWNECDYKLWSKAGEEKSIASTKALTAQMFCLYLVLIKILDRKGIDTTSYIKALSNLSTDLEVLFESAPKVKEVAKTIAKYQHIAILGAKSYFYVAKEGALKMKETSYSDANAYPQGEFMHGHVAVLNSKGVIIALVDDSYSDIIKRNLSKIREDYETYVITVSGEDNIPVADVNFKVPCENKAAKLFSTLVMLQLFAFENALALGRDVDKPQGLKKVVIA